jgi:hypothetical protein
MDEKDAFSIAAFCARHGFSRAGYYNLPPNERPREMRIGSRVLISKEAAADWRRDRENLASRPRQTA